MQKFHHPHIIKLVGVCTEQPVLLIMELARLGEVRDQLTIHTSSDLSSSYELISLPIDLILMFSHYFSIVNN